jgi:HEAT repeat protein
VSLLEFMRDHILPYMPYNLCQIKGYCVFALQVSLLEFMRDHILPYIDDGDKEVRQAAALACCRVLDRHAAASAAATAAAAAAANTGAAGHAAVAAAAAAAAAADKHAASLGSGGMFSTQQQQQQQMTQQHPSLHAAVLMGVGAAGGGGLGLGLRQTKVVEVVVGKLLMAAVADTSERVRRTVLEVGLVHPFDAVAEVWMVLSEVQLYGLELHFLMPGDCRCLLRGGYAVVLCHFTSACFDDGNKIHTIWCWPHLHQARTQAHTSQRRRMHVADSTRALCVVLFSARLVLPGSGGFSCYRDVLRCCTVLLAPLQALKSSPALGKHLAQAEQPIPCSTCLDPVLLLPSSALQALTSSPALDEYLAQADCLRALFVALNDESKDVRATAVQLVGRLASWNPAYVAPALRRHLLQLLTDMDNSPDSKQRDDSAYLINCLINSAPQLIMPYVSPIQKVGADKSS